jgi:hypothetical protein
MMPSKVVGG